LLHKHNEYIVPAKYLSGIKVYESIIKHLADIWPEVAPPQDPLMHVDL
jgi:hypothetical protein